MSIRLNPKLYQQVKAEADAKFASKTSIYKSSWIVREYKKRGGTYKDNERPRNTGLLRWYREQWIDLNRPILNKRGQVTGYQDCGRPSSSSSTSATYPLCRPLKRVSKLTPTTVGELTAEEIRIANKLKQNIRNLGSISKFRQ